MKQAAKRPSNSEFLALVNSPDPLRVAVRGQQCLELLLEEAINETLFQAHTLEVHNLSFALKVDLATALGIVPPDERPAYVKVNKIRNLFAHEPDAEFATTDAHDLYNILSNRQRRCLGKEFDEFTEAIDVLRYCLAALRAGLQVNITRIRDTKALAIVQHELVQETIGEAKPDDPYLREIREEIESRVAVIRAARQAAGEL
jgi:hypothetical protein